MRPLLAALLLVFQLQPLLGTAACLGLIKQPTQASCEMPEHGIVPSQSLTGPAPLSTQSCAIASLCAPAPLAVPSFAGLLETTLLLHNALGIAGTTLPLDVSSAPPFHPPKA
ncbi:MAG: hypothetical protein ABI785_07310 [Gemmatimonadales bacterium]